LFLVITGKPKAKYGFYASMLFTFYIKEALTNLQVFWRFIKHTKFQDPTLEVALISLTHQKFAWLPC